MAEITIPQLLLAPFQRSSVKRLGLQVLPLIPQHARQAHYKKSSAHFSVGRLGQGAELLYQRYSASLKRHCARPLALWAQYFVALSSIVHRSSETQSVG
jgi:hypothetical protein